MAERDDKPQSGLSGQEAARFVRQIMLPEVGVDGQARLIAGTARVLGDALAECYVRRAGVTQLGPSNADTVPEGAHVDASASASDGGPSRNLASARLALRELVRLLDG